MQMRDIFAISRRNESSRLSDFLVNAVTKVKAETCFSA